jgi:hypothetical protein
MVLAAILFDRIERVFLDLGKIIGFPVVESDELLAEQDRALLTSNGCTEPENDQENSNANRFSIMQGSSIHNCPDRFPLMSEHEWNSVFLILGAIDPPVLRRALNSPCPEAPEYRKVF